MNLCHYWGKRVRITAEDGQVLVGNASYYTSEHDDPDGVASLSLEVDGRDGILISVEESEIASIEIITADIPVFAEAV